MRLVSYRSNSGNSVGLLKDDYIIDLAKADANLPGSLLEIISQGAAAISALRKVEDADPEGARIPLDNIEFLPPVPKPPKILCMGLNFTDHAKEGGNPIPDYPALFMRTASSLIGHTQPLVRPKCSHFFDYEAELMVIIGKKCKHVAEKDALDCVFGYSVFNDGSVRDYQRKSNQWTAGKNFDGTGPVGPAIVTADEVPEGAHGLRMVSRLNGTVLQDGNTANMIFPVAKTIEILSEIMTLEPGDHIAMGTPAGVGYPRNPPVFMKPGDIMEIEIEGLGTLRNPVIDEPTVEQTEAAE